MMKLSCHWVILPKSVPAVIKQEAEIQKQAFEPVLQLNNF